MVVIVRGKSGSECSKWVGGRNDFFSNWQHQRRLEAMAFMVGSDGMKGFQQKETEEQGDFVDLE